MDKRNAAKQNCESKLNSSQPSPRQKTRFQVAAGTVFFCSMFVKTYSIISPFDCLLCLIKHKKEWLTQLMTSMPFLIDFIFFS